MQLKSMVKNEELIHIQKTTYSKEGILFESENYLYTQIR
jgi:hypothetical protein